MSQKAESGDVFTSVKETIEDTEASIEKLLHSVSDLAKTLRAEGMTNCANRFMVAGGFLCLAIWTMTGMPGAMVSLRLLELAPAIADIDCDNCPRNANASATSQANPNEPNHLPN